MRLPKRVSIQIQNVGSQDFFITGSVHSSNAKEEFTGIYEWTRGRKNADDTYKFTRRSGNKNMEAFVVCGVHYLDQILLDYPPGSDCDCIREQW